MARTVPVWTHLNGYWTSDVEAVALEALGSSVNQTAAQTEEARWLALVRDNAGAGTNFQFLGGDVTDGFRTSGDDIVWVGADWFSGTTIDADDTYAGLALPACRSGAILESTDGDFGQQLHATGSTGNWLDAVSQGSLPAQTTWWPITGLNDGGTNRVFCWRVSDAAPRPPYGKLVEVDLVSLNVFGGYASHVALGLGASDVFWVEDVVRDTSFTYVLGEQFTPDYDADVGASGTVPNYGRDDFCDDYTSHRLARVPNGQLTTPASWTFWDGAAWASTVTSAVVLTDVTGRLVKGDAGLKKVAEGSWLLVAHQLTDTHVDVYRGPAPTGPWTRYVRVPAPTQGSVLNGGRQIGQFAKPLDFTPPAVPAGHSMVLLSRNLLGFTDPFSQLNIRRFAPQFVVVPHPT